MCVRAHFVLLVVGFLHEMCVWEEGERGSVATSPRWQRLCIVGCLV